MISEGLDLAVSDIPAREQLFDDGNRRVQFWVESAIVGHPVKDNTESGQDSRLLPWECRERGLTYAAPLVLTFGRKVDDGRIERYERKVGNIPIMIRSARCHTAGCSPEELIDLHEEPNEVGGYFICNGIERIVRMLQMPRRNHIMAIQRPSYTKRGPLYSNKAVSVRSARPDQSTITLTLHYLHDGNAMLRFSVKKQEFFLPVALALRALKDTTDREVYQRVLAGQAGATFLSDRLELILSDAKRFGVYTPGQVRALLGSRFRAVLDMPESLTDEEAGQVLFDRYILVHLSTDDDKFNFLVLMLRKLYGFAAGDVKADNPDSLQNQELLLGGHLYQIFLKEKIEELLVGVQGGMARDLRRDPTTNITDMAYFRKLIDRSADIGKKIYYLLATGNLVSTSGLDQMQVSGFTVVADKINYLRFVTHFRSVHRGQFFTEMRTTAVRKLLPESWGFLCPVHTPDGAPCGLLNHLAAPAQLVTHNVDASGMDDVLVKLGMAPTRATGMMIPASHMPIVVDGRVAGSAPVDAAFEMAAALRRLKGLSYIMSGHSVCAHGWKPLEGAGEDEWQRMAALVPPSLEVAFFPPPLWELQREAKAAGASADSVEVSGAIAGAYPGLFLGTQAARMVRPVRQVDTGMIEWIGPMEQVFMEIACKGDDSVEISPQPEPSSLVEAAKRGEHVYTHMELTPMAMLSLAASLTPFSDMNQSPRNMYQCQMGKQTMGTPCHAYTHRTDTKLYRIQTPQAPIVQTEAHSHYGMDEYAAGTNAIVAVIAYTGFDMEDAMIINKSSYERGFGHGSVYKTKEIDLAMDLKSGDPPKSRFTNPPMRGGEAGERLCASLDRDGLPPVGLYVKQGDPIAVSVDVNTGKPKVHKHKESEPAYIDEVRLLGANGKDSGTLQRVSIKLRFNRNPVVGDKFSSRHGQKGVLSILWPQTDMPFSESGMNPDVIINPHAFPSRMTIGMLVESMAGKAGALHGRFQDATPFRFSDRSKVVDYFGAQLQQAGYSYYGSEPLYSGVTGETLHADIYLGVVYYQRLRHMVSDKSQVRALGAINALTRQPIKGRKKGGGIRFGEMERDSLLAHGVSHLLHDRLMNSSDRHVGAVCSQCGSMLTVHTTPVAGVGAASGGEIMRHGDGAAAYVCRHCQASGKGDGQVVEMPLPYVYRYLANELAAMNIRVGMEVSK
jgi:DNA-directed RNA polymerase I subunit RPA2